MVHSAQATLWWLAPGLAHQLGNALFTLQGRARLLAMAEPGRLADDSRAIQEGVERAGASMHLLRWLIEDGRSQAVPVAHVMQHYAEAARVPLRDHGVVLEIEGFAEAPSATIDPGPFCRLLTAALRELCASAAGAHGTVRIGLAVDGEVRLRLDFVPAAGSPPVPRDADGLIERLRGVLPGSTTRTEKGGDDALLALCLPIVRTTFRSS